MGLEFQRYFTHEGRDVYGSFDWEKGDIDITDDSGKKMFTQKGVEFPKTWSPIARKIVASRYFFGERETPERESSARQLVGRVTETFYDWSGKQGYFDSDEEREAFRDELTYISLDQKAAFNSPVWFNVGIDRLTDGIGRDEKEMYIIDEGGGVVRVPVGEDRKYPQTSACFIQSVEDTMEDIMDLAKREALLFKHGSGTGTNLSTLRSFRERLSGGGKPSGPLAYWAFYDKVAGIVKSGGKTRRAAKMNILNIDHPDILEFISSKATEEEYIRILVANGVSKQKAQESVNYQNTNISIRARDDFFRAVDEDGKWKTVPVHSHDIADQMPIYSARELLRKIAETTWACGDPGMQFEDNINRWHTCPNTARINASNPCAEYMFLDDSSCNLASTNLMKFMSDGVFDVEAFGRVVRTMAIAQDLEIDNSSYPTEKIAENSHKYRPLGMGYANLGSLVMSQGLPYDSDEARAIAASITALMTGKVYETSTEIAEKLGTFEGYDANKEPMLKVIKMHRDALQGIDRTKIPEGLENILDEAEVVWDRVIERGEQYGFRNAQATVLAPTGTIGFMMDCDTKGVEPEIGLVQTKRLSDGGTIQMVNSTVDLALQGLGYGEQERENILSYIKENETVEGSRDLKEEHLAVFDCANKPDGKERTISYRGHLKMMAAVQPFLSGAISKTVNLPNDVSIEDIERTYKEAHEMGLKSVALYRDGSKGVQVLSFSKKGGLEERAQPVRRKLPITREGIISKFNIVGHKGYIIVGKYPDGTPGEIFVNIHKEGSTVAGLLGVLGNMTSQALQYGMPLKSVVNIFRGQKFEPRGLVHEGHPDIHTAESFVDYIGNFLKIEFLDGEDLNGDTSEFPVANNPGKETEGKPVVVGELGGFCPTCSAQLFKRGHCEEYCVTPKCGYQNWTGCGSH